MEAIDKSTKAFIEATDIEVQHTLDDMLDPPDASLSQGINAPTRQRKRPEEVQYFLKSNTLAVLERLHNIATDCLYTRDDQGNRVRQQVQPGVQLQAATAFLDRAMGKPQVNVDLTSGDRPIMFDAAFQARPLIQASIEPMEQHDDENDDI